MLDADANATTPMPAEVLAAWAAAANRGHPTDGPPDTARATEKLLGRFQAQVERRSGLAAGEFRLVFTSGAAEANTLVIEASVAAWGRLAAGKPHLVVGATDPPSVLLCAERLRGEGRCMLSYARADPAAGAPTAQTVREVIRDNTCLVSVAGANAFTGALADLRSIGAACFAGRRRVPFHSDLSLLLPRSASSPEDLSLDAFSVSAHLMHGPPGFGFLALRESFAETYALRALVAGRLLNVPGLAATSVAYAYTLDARGEKNARLRAYAGGIAAVLATAFDFYDAARPLPDDPPPLPPGGRRVVLCGPPPARRLPNTLLLAVQGAGSAAQLHAALAAGGPATPPVCVRAVHDAGALRCLHVPAALHACVIRVSLPDSATKKIAQDIAQALVLAIQA